MKQNFVSIIINNYNYARFLREAIDSALGQTYSECEVIVVDDGSSDESHQIIDEYSGKVLPILKPNGGQASAINAGIQVSNGEFILFLDADDIFTHKKAERVVEIFRKNEEAGWCFHPLKMVDSEGVILPSSPERFTGNSGLYDVSGKVRRGKLSGTLPFKGTATSGMCFRSSFLEKLSPIPEEIRITSDDFLKYAAFGLSPGYILLEYVANQRIHGKNAYTLRNDIESLRLDVDMMTAYWLRNRFPELAMFSHNLYADVLQKLGNNHIPNSKVSKLIARYNSTLSVPEKAFIMLKRIYYTIKL